MDENLYSIENLFKAALEDNEEIPPSKVWEGVEHSLDKDEVINIKKKYENLKKVAFLLLFLLTAHTIYEWDKSKTGNNVTERKGNLDKGTVSEDKKRNTADNKSTIVFKKLIDTKSVNPNIAVDRNALSNHSRCKQIIIF